MLVNQPSSTPTRKVSAVGVVTIVVPVVILLAGVLGIDINEVELTNTLTAGIAFVTGLIALVTAYQTKERA